MKNKEDVKAIAQLEVGSSKLRDIAHVMSNLSYAKNTIMQYESKDEVEKNPNEWIPSEKEYEVAKEKAKLLESQLKTMEIPSVGFTFGKK